MTSMVNDSDGSDEGTMYTEHQPKTLMLPPFLSLVLSSWIYCSIPHYNEVI